MSFTKLSLLGGITLSIAAAQSLTVVNSDFSAVAVRCSTGYAYQSAMGGNCAGSNGFGPQQNFNFEAGIGWTFSLSYDAQPNPGGAGITEPSPPNSGFETPPFTGLPFSQAALLQSQSVIFQRISGFVAGQIYKLTFYLGSRYDDSGQSQGNQTVLATLDNVPIGVWKLVSFTPFTLRTAVFKVATGGSHILAFRGTVTNPSTAFFSDVSIEAVQ
ncbi:MAG: hypothetical protein ABSH32_17875 [Bryobacteraceae bacterium]|jgi:hypothetical protein